jgi:hypothetical protein
MRNFRGVILVLALSCFADIFANDEATAQTIYFGVEDIALKNGESTEFGEVYYIGQNCKSLLKATPEVEILDGPPGVTAAIREEMIVPRSVGCAKPVPGGKLVISVQGIEDYSRTRMVLRIKLKTSLGDRQYSRDVNISLLP